MKTFKIKNLILTEQFNAYQDQIIDVRLDGRLLILEINPVGSYRIMSQTEIEKITNLFENSLK